MRRVLMANRGEIALRIMRACRRAIAGVFAVATSSCGTTDVVVPTPSSVEFAAGPADARAGGIMSAVTILVRDSMNVPVGGGVRVVLSLDAPPAGVQLSGTTAQLTVNGYASFTDLVITAPAQGLRLRAEVEPVAPVRSATFDVGARLRILDAVAGAELGTPLAPVRVAIQTDAGVTITAAITSVTARLISAVESTDASGSAVDGVVTFGGLLPRRPGAGYRLVAVAPGLDPDTSSTFAVGWNPVELAAGNSHTCGRSASGAVVCVGDNYEGVIGAYASSTGEVVPILVPAPVPFLSLASGEGHLCAIASAGQAYCWGDNNGGELGRGPGGSSANPAPVSGGIAFRALAAGHQFTCGLSVDSLAYCWGAPWGIGDGTGMSRSVPTAVTGGRRYVSIAAGGIHACALTGTGEAWCWGENANGQLGDGTDSARTAPVRSAAGHALVRIAAGAFVTCGLDAGGSAWCWGLGSSTGSFASAGLSRVDTAVAVDGGHRFVSIVTGSGHACGVTSAGAAYCWGLTVNGQCGHGWTNGENWLVPVTVLDTHAWSSIVAGAMHTCGLDGTGAWCWGRDERGQLGDGPPFANANRPVRMLH